MPKPRYHIHLACVADDFVLRTAQDDVAIFAEGRAYLTKDLLINRARSANYSWRCVNDCDVVVMLIGGSYGVPNASGVSQLHLSFSNAKTTKKPMVILIHNAAKHSTDQRLHDFIKTVESQMPQAISYFDESKNMLSILEGTVGRIFTQKEQDKQMARHLEHATPKTTETPPQSGQLSEIRAKKLMPKNTLQPALLLHNEFEINCTAHAFQGGTLINVEFTAKMTWHQIIWALVEFGVSFSSQGLMRCLNEQIDKKHAHDAIVAMYPEVHAVSRHQVSKSDALWIQDELQLAGHIVPIDINGTSTLWKVTPEAKEAILKHQAVSEAS